MTMREIGLVVGCSESRISQRLNRSFCRGCDPPSTDWDPPRRSSLWIEWGRSQSGKVLFQCPDQPKIICLFVLLVLAIGSNLLFTTWGSNLDGTPVLTIRLGTEPPSTTAKAHGFGLYSPVSIEEAPWMSMSLGLLLPLACIGMIVYILVRLDSKPTEL